MKLREHDKQALQIIATSKSVGGRYYDFEKFLELYGRWGWGGIFPVQRARAVTARQEAFCFLDADSILMLVDSIVAELKAAPENKIYFNAFELYFLIPAEAEGLRAKKERILKAQLTHRRRQFLRAYTQAREKFQELIRQSLLNLLKA